MNVDIGSFYTLTEDLRLKNINRDAEVFEKGTRLECIWSPWKNEYHFRVLGRIDGIKIALNAEPVSNILVEETEE